MYEGIASIFRLFAKDSIMGPQTIGASTHHAQDADWHRSQQGVKELFMAIHDGDAASAQRAHALVAKGSGDINGNSPMAQIVAALGTGDLAAAQRLAQSLQMSREGSLQVGTQAARPSLWSSLHSQGSQVDAVA